MNTVNAVSRVFRVFRGLIRMRFADPVPDGAQDDHSEDPSDDAEENEHKGEGKRENGEWKRGNQSMVTPLASLEVVIIP